MNKEKYKFDEKGNKEEYKFSHDEYGNAVEHEGEIYDDDESVIDEDGKNCCTLCCDKTCSCLFTVACFPLKCMCNCLWTMIWVNGCGFTLNWRGWLEKMYVMRIEMFMFRGLLLYTTVVLLFLCSTSSVAIGSPDLILYHTL